MSNNAILLFFSELVPSTNTSEMKSNIREQLDISTQGDNNKLWIEHAPQIDYQVMLCKY